MEGSYLQEEEFHSLGTLAVKDTLVIDSQKEDDLLADLMVYCPLEPMVGSLHSH